ncbi:hypothetical protein SAMN05192534_11431 [Alteribacillus persepolensis]|uniref:Uncharacterized protein n=1 Tax=Alteribacillus persepolensis TaxID=568899 RepID=A0A1G8G3Z2_9BACI|nr:hypothetical protein [Alteribacillus persepolensis]SDH89114.1 hypothetical protein SAMN05192534_11431 [Alteribacillus persepolensis]
MKKQSRRNWYLSILTLVVLIGIASYVFITPIFSHEYTQLTERVEIGLEYTDISSNKEMYVHPYVENPNSHSDLTITYEEESFDLQVLDANGNVLEGAVTKEYQHRGQSHSEQKQTTLKPGQKEKSVCCYKITFPQEADRLQLAFQGKVQDEFGAAEIKETIEVLLRHLSI